MDSDVEHLVGEQLLDSKEQLRALGELGFSKFDCFGVDLHVLIQVLLKQVGVL